ncbi:cyclic nucleotide-binding/CBS domain-containing protein [Thermodesulfobacteriota bacterium]
MDVTKLRVKDLMKKDVKTAGKEMSLLRAVKMMQEYGVSSLVVEPENNGDSFSIITRKDIVETFMEDEMGGSSLRIADVMTSPAITVTADLNLSNCHRLMRMVVVRRLPVVDGNELVGIISNTDIITALAKDLSESSEVAEKP